MAGQHIGPAGAAVIAALLQPSLVSGGGGRRAALQRLGLAGTWVGVEGAKDLAAALRGNDSLAVLDLSGDPKVCAGRVWGRGGVGLRFRLVCCRAAAFWCVLR